MLTRRRLLQTAVPVLLLGACGGKENQIVRYASLSEAQAGLDRLQAGGSRSAGPISVHQMLIHCAQSLEYALAGFPELKPRWFRATMGPAAAQVFLWRGQLSHDIAEPIPGAPPIPSDGDMSAAFGRIRMAIAAFGDAVRDGKTLQPHFAYGEVAPSDYARLQAFHIAEHMQAVA